MILTLKPIFKTALLLAEKHLPGILTGTGIAGCVAGTVLAVAATPKAMKAIDEELDRQTDILPETYRVEYTDRDGSVELEIKPKLTKIETVKTCWKFYIPAILVIATSIGLLIGGCHVSAKRNAALSAAYLLSEGALNDYKQATKEVVGEEKAAEIHKKVTTNNIEKTFPPSDMVDKLSLNGNYPCFDRFSGQWFSCNEARIHNVVTELNYRMLYEQYIPLSDFYYDVGAESQIILGDDFGWHIDHGPIEIRTDAEMRNGIPVCIVEFATKPDYLY